MASTADCKKFIVQWVRENPADGLEACLEAANWKRRSKYMHQGVWNRLFTMGEEPTFPEAACVVSEDADGNLGMEAFFTDSWEVDLIGKPSQIIFNHKANEDGEWFEIVSLPMAKSGIVDQHLPESAAKTMLTQAGFDEAAESFWVYWPTGEEADSQGYQKGLQWMLDQGFVRQKIFD